MQLFNTVAASSILLTLTAAQNSSSTTSGSTTTAQSNYGLVPSTVDIGLRQYWCNQQTASCPLICGDINNDDASIIQNSCYPESLTYQCVCSNGQSPNATQYTQTIPYFECTTSADQCVANCGPSDAECQGACRTSRKCGATDIKKENRTTPTPSSPAATASSTDGMDSSLINGSGMGAATTFGPSLGFVALAGLVTMGLAVVL